VVVGSHHHQGGHGDGRQRGHDPVVVLDQHPAGGVDQAPGVAVPGLGHLGRQARGPVGLDGPGEPLGHAVPPGPGLGVAEPRAGVDQQQAGHPLGVAQVVGEGEVAAERHAAHNGPVGPGLGEEGVDVTGADLLGVGPGVVGGVALAVAAEVPHDHGPAGGQRRHVGVPHGRGGGEAVRQDQRCPRAARVVHGVGDVDAVVPLQHVHGRRP
jgi:hypothetical protein